MPIRACFLIFYIDFKICQGLKGLIFRFEMPNFVQNSKFKFNIDLTLHFVTIQNDNDYHY